jgi:hypothetical protein
LGSNSKISLVTKVVKKETKGIWSKKRNTQQAQVLSSVGWVLEITPNPYWVWRWFWRWVWSWFSRKSNTQFCYINNHGSPKLSLMTTECSSYTLVCMILLQV